MPLRGPTFHCTPPRLRRVNATGTHPVGFHRGVVVLRLQWTRLRHVNLTDIPSGFVEAKPGLRFGSSWLRLVNLTGDPVGLYIGCFVLRLCSSRLRLVNQRRGSALAAVNMPLVFCRLFLAVKIFSGIFFRRHYFFPAS